MGSLFDGSIVDFLCEPRVALESEGITTIAPTFAPARVHFSKFSQLVIISYDDVEPKWYTQEEQRHLYQACLSDIRRLGDMLRNAALVLNAKTSSTIGWASRTTLRCAHSTSCSSEEASTLRGNSLGAEDAPGRTQD